MKVFPAFLLLGVGIVLGYSMGRRSSNIVSQVTATPPAESRVVNASPVGFNRQADKISDAAFVSNRLEVLDWILANHAGSIFIPPVQFGRITPEFLKAYGLSDAQGQILQKAMDDAKNDLDRAAIANATVKATSDKTVILVPQLPQIGAEVFDRLHASFSQVLGKDRYDFFRRLSQDSLDNTWGYAGFGVDSVEYNVSKKAETGGVPIYTIEVTNTSPEGQKSESGSFVDWKTMEAKFPIVAKLYKK